MCLFRIFCLFSYSRVSSRPTYIIFSGHRSGYSSELLCESAYDSDSDCGIASLFPHPYKKRWQKVTNLWLQSWKREFMISIASGVSALAGYMIWDANKCTRQKQQLKLWIVQRFQFGTCKFGIYSVKIIIPRHVYDQSSIIIIYSYGIHTSRCTWSKYK